MIFRCAICKEIFSSTAEQELKAIHEYEMNFHDEPVEVVRVCHDCYSLIMEEHHEMKKAQ
jgi:hypothetical protein